MSAKALIFHGGWEGHEPEACAAIVEELLADEGFDVRSEAGVAVLGEADLASFDLIVPLCTQISIEKAPLERLCAHLPTNSWWAANGLPIPATSSTTASRSRSRSIR